MKKLFLIWSLVFLLLSCSSDKGTDPTSSNTPPTAAAALLPANGAASIDTPVTITWQAASDSDSDTIRYILIVDTVQQANPDSAMLSYELTDTSKILTQVLDLNKTYYWMITVTDSIDSTSAGWYSFTTRSLKYKVRQIITYDSIAYSVGENSFSEQINYYYDNTHKVIRDSNFSDTGLVSYTIYTYDTANRKTSDSAHNSAGLLVGGSVYQYDTATGSLERRDSVSGLNAWTYHYDATGALDNEKYYFSGNYIQLTTFEYNTSGKTSRRLVMNTAGTDTNQVYAFTYDGLGRDSTEVFTTHGFTNYTARYGYSTSQEADTLTYIDHTGTPYKKTITHYTAY